MSPRQISDIARLVEPGLRVPWPEVRAAVLARLRRAWRDGGGTQKGMAAALGVHEPTVQRWLRSPEIRKAVCDD